MTLRSQELQTAPEGEVTPKAGAMPPGDHAIPTTPSTPTTPHAQSASGFESASHPTTSPHHHHGNGHARARGDGPKRSSARDHVAFLVEFIRSPSQLSSLFPTHPEIGRSMVRGLDLARAKAVAELGPGTGTITRAVLECLRPGTAFFAVELNARLAGLFRKNFPEVRLFQGDAANLREYCNQLNVAQLDAVVSALPWTTIPHSIRGRIVDAAASSLKPGGIMTWVTYRSPKMKSVRAFNDELRSKGFNVGEATVVREALVRAHVFHCVLER